VISSPLKIKFRSTNTEILPNPLTLKPLTIQNLKKGIFIKSLSIYNLSYMDIQ
jgi:hypothetical protein